MPTIRKNATPENIDAMLSDDSLSLKAKGLLTMLANGLDEPSLATIGQATSDGRSAITSAIRDAEAAGYLVREREHDERGRLAQYRWTVDFKHYQ